MDNNIKKELWVGEQLEIEVDYNSKDNPLKETETCWHLVCGIEIVKCVDIKCCEVRM